MNTNIINQFKKNIKYKNFGFFLTFSSIFCGIFYNSNYKILIISLMLVLGLLLQLKYVCPKCNYRFDPRTKEKEIHYCPNCSTKLK